MDPNATLARIRELCGEIRALEASGGYNKGALAMKAVELNEAVDALDEWLIGGGFLPSAWNLNR